MRDACCVDADEAQQAHYSRYAAATAATAAILDSLSHLHIWFMYKAFCIGKAWKFLHADAASTPDEAMRGLEKRLRRNVGTAILF